MGSFEQRAYSRRLVERFSAEVAERLGAALPGAARSELVAIATTALSASIDALETPTRDHTRSLPVARLSAADVIAGGRTGMSQATLYRAADSGRYYSVTPGGRSNGKQFPAWQFVEPVPELIAPVLACLAQQAGSEVHAFWVTSADELNELAPAEMLAGCPFDIRGALHASQRTLLGLPSQQRQQKVLAFAQQQSSGKAVVIG
ncbi:hypothetical protein [Massilia sp. TWR1-2-2]|uniref:hypothetical protein n=1 Tax=Massilia sp. TWR1-2-2 TaxID=2804584 RepID=UPI003CEDFC09